MVQAITAQPLKFPSAHGPQPGSVEPPMTISHAGWSGRPWGGTVGFLHQEFNMMILDEETPP